MACRALRDWPGCSSIRCRATPAWTLIREMLWASTSCSSRAMRMRSSPARRFASSARVRSAARRRWRPAMATSATTRTSSRVLRWAAAVAGVAGSTRPMSAARMK